MTKKNISLGSGRLTIKKAYAIATGTPVSIAKSALQAVSKSRCFVESIAKQDLPYYGINTGFGYFANQKIGKTQLKELQRNIIISHACGFGEPLSKEEVRLAMALRLNVLLAGMTGVRIELCEALSNLLKHEISPIVPQYGSVGASGDLAPLAHLALPLIGEGNVVFQGHVMPAKQALKKAKLKPITLEEKEGLSLINGTQIMLAVGTLAIQRTQSLLELAELAAALSFEGMIGNLDALDSRIHIARNQSGQIQSAKTIAQHLKGSYLHKKSTKRLRVQDPYSLRCAPQVHGASRDTITHALTIIERELNAVTDNPLVFDDASILSGGNFHGQPLALAFDTASLALSELSNISERRLELLLNPHFSGLNAFLAKDEGLHSGYMTTQYLCASLVNANKHLANPTCTDSIPGNVGVEDHVSMGMTSALKLKTLTRNVMTVLATEIVVACQAIDLRKVSSIGKGTMRIYKKIRKEIPMLQEDRITAIDIEKAVAIIEELLTKGEFHD